MTLFISVIDILTIISLYMQGVPDFHAQTLKMII